MALRDVARQNKSKIRSWFFMHDADHKFPGVPLSVVYRPVSIFKVGIGAHRGPDGARVSRWPMGTENPGPNPASSSWLLLYVFIYSRCELGTGKRRNEQQLAKTKTDNACASSEQRVTASIHAGKRPRRSRWRKQWT